MFRESPSDYYCRIEFKLPNTSLDVKGSYPGIELSLASLEMCDTGRIAARH